MIDPIEIKQGTTFSLPMLVMLPAGTWSAACNIRKSDDTLVGSLSVTLTALDVPDADGHTHSGAAVATSVASAAWELGTWRADVRFTDTSAPPTVFNSETFPVVIKKGVTHG